MILFNRISPSSFGSLGAQFHRFTRLGFLPLVALFPRWLPCLPPRIFRTTVSWLPIFPDLAISYDQRTHPLFSTNPGHTAWVLRLVNTGFNTVLLVFRPFFNPPSMYTIFHISPSRCHFSTSPSFCEMVTGGRDVDFHQSSTMSLLNAAIDLCNTAWWQQPISTPPSATKAKLPNQAGLFPQSSSGGPTSVRPRLSRTRTRRVPESRKLDLLIGNAQPGLYPPISPFFCFSCASPPHYLPIVISLARKITGGLALRK